MAGDIILSNGTTITAAELAEIAGEVKKLIAKEAKEPSQYEEVQSLANLTTLPALLQNGLEFKLVRVAVQLLNPVLQKTDLAIQWKRGDTGQFVDLITIAEIQAPAKAATDAANAAATKANTAATNADKAATSATSAASAANQAAAYANETADHTPIIGEDGYWYRWDAEQDVYVKTDDYAKGGADYPVFGLDVETMNVTVDAVISNDRYAVTDDGVLVVLF